MCVKLSHSSVNMSAATVVVMLPTGSIVKLTYLVFLKVFGLFLVNGGSIKSIADDSLR